MDWQIKRKPSYEGFLNITVTFEANDLSTSSLFPNDVETTSLVYRADPVIIYFTCLILRPGMTD
ncbi:MAG: hypothetical protein P4L35_12730 [Ignavibacteriaceae bacterium]|nr:hypothetical protein [Ignavibacteriaceae bacterium]